MKRRTQLPELLAPAGSIDALYAAVEAGADAVYLGLDEGATNARVGARNLTREELWDAVPYAHAHGVRVYVTMNTLQYDREREAFLDAAAFLRDAGVDALIVADLGCMRLIRERMPSMELHASTQAFAHASAAADALFSLGCTRVVLARELSLDNIRSAVERSRAEIEIFLHGALCVSHSGQCLFSSLVGGRSGNRGACAQPCRLPYNGGFPLSLKDLCLAPHIPELIASGVASLKIEGRMKSPDYVFGVTRIYRRLLDEGRAATGAELEALARLFSRDGFTDAYFTDRIGRGMTGVRRETDKAETRTLAQRRFSRLPVSVFASARVVADEPMRMTLSLSPLDRQNGGRYPERRGEAVGAVPGPAKSAAMTAAALAERLSKMGDTFLRLCENDLALSLDAGLFMPVGAQNALRREAVAALYASLRAPLSPLSSPPAPALRYACAWEAPMRTAHFLRWESYLEADTSYFDLCFLPLEALSRIADERLPAGVALPPVVTDGEWDEVLRMARAASARGVRYALVSGLGTAALAREAGLTPFGDFRLNAVNQGTVDTVKELGLAGLVLSPELSPAAARPLGGSVIVYGRVPLMLTERCFVKDTLGCKRCGEASLTDRMGVDFPVLRVWKHRGMVLNSLPTYLGDLAHERRLLAGLGAHFIFSDETPEEVKEVVEAYRAAAPLARRVRRAVKA